jgi:hypothetical protein
MSELFIHCNCSIIFNDLLYYVCDVTLSVYPLRVTSQTSYSPEYTTPTQKISIVLVAVAVALPS